MENIDVIVIGAGVVGLAIAARLSKHYTNVLVVDKNNSFGEETSSRNSEVIHGGIYYPENSLKARLCVAGKNKLYQYCQERHIPVNRLGKLIVAHGTDEEAFLEKTVIMAERNGVKDLSWLSQSQIYNASPDICATSALLSPSTGIIDVHNYMQSLLAEIEQQGGLFVARTAMLHAEPTAEGFKVTLESQGDISHIGCRYLINSAGLHSTKVADNITGMPKTEIPQLHWCRGHYFAYHGKSPFKQLIYPIPEAHGLGIHASLDMAGQLKFGPDTQYVTQLDYQFPLNLKDKFICAIQKYFPTLDINKLQPAYSGIRPKLQGEGEGFRDFMIQDASVHGLAGLVNLFGIDSPGLTSSLAIADQVAQQLVEK